MDCLPNEVIAEILSYIHPIYSNLPKLRGVCWKWRRIVETTSSLWKHIHLDDDRDCIIKEDCKHTIALRICLTTYRQFIQCIRAEDQPYLNHPEVRKLIPKLCNLRKLDVPLLTWTKHFAETLESRLSLTEVTLNDCMIQNNISTTPGLERRRSIIKGLKGWELNFIHTWFPNLQVLGLHTSIHKIRRGSIVAILDSIVNLKDLRLELTPYALTAGDEEPSNSIGVPPVREIMNSRHCSILTSLELRYLAISSKDLMDFTNGLKRLRHLVVGSIASMNHETFSTALVLESSSLLVLYLSSLPSSWTKTIKLDMINLEVLVISQCIELTSLELHANNLLSLALRDNLSLKNISAKCESINQLELLECHEFDLEKFKNFIRQCPSIVRIELTVEWESIELDSRDCPELKKFIIRDADLLLRRVKIDCKTLEVFKCLGYFMPRKCSRRYRFKGCQFEIICDNLKKLNVRDVYHTTSVRVQCNTIDTLELSGRSIVLRAIDFDIIAIRRINVFSLKEVNIQSVSICCPSVGDIMLDDCILTQCADHHYYKMKINCNVLEALRVIKCDRIKGFALKVPHVGQLSLDSCRRLCHLNIADVSKVGRVRIVNCPLLNYSF